MKFYRFKTAYTEGEFKVKPILDTEFDFYKPLYDQKGLKQGHQFNIVEGEEIFDLVSFIFGSNFLISKKFSDILNNNKITGFELIKANIEGVTGEFYSFLNIGKAGPILNLKDVNTYKTKNRQFDLSTWDGSDIFTLERTLLNVCTEKVKDLIEQEGISNIKFLPL